MTTSPSRGGAAYDLFGNGKTSIKLNVGKYLEAATNHNTYSLTNPAARMAGSPVLGAPPAVTRVVDRRQRQLRARLRSARSRTRTIAVRPAAICAAS